ncbi:MAG: DNA mismatch repair protein MutS [Flavobacteriales bacterium]|nr:DNA mismatch repair protein MutS [Flavobacteriales bacterium]
MKFFDEQTAIDLEFDQIRSWLVGYCKTETASSRLLKLQPYRSSKEVVRRLDLVHELQLIRHQGLTFPRMEFRELKKEIRLLGIQGSVIELEGIVNLLDASRFVNALFAFFKEHTDQYPQLKSLLKDAHPTKAIEKEITKILDRRMQVKDDASDDLMKIRQRMSRCKQQINRNFEKALKSAQQNGYIDDLKENIIGNRRVLTIVSNHKRQVDGNVLGSSKTGSLTYIEPQANIALNSEYDQLLDDERIEIRRIFAQLTNFFRDYYELIQAYQSIIVSFDEVNARERLAKKLNGVKPQVNLQDQNCDYKEAYHPILWVQNQAENLPTIPQSFHLRSDSRLMVISGPNAGGKSITLKTVGLIQLMFQSGLLVPLSTRSKLGFFDYILSDIGDNQSIANQLSTYSHRLQRMRFFLDKLGSKTLLLLDEFGTGSDPELGGALAEVFFEEIYEKKCFGVITTHYSNIKLRAAQMPEAINANMLFNRKTLKPEYQLEVGQPGSSFTFEVAQMNGIPQKMLKAAKQKVDSQKIQMDQLISDLQKDRSILKKLKDDNYQATLAMEASREEYEEKSEHFEQRLSKQQQLIEKNNKYLNHGRKMAQFIEEFPISSKKKQTEFLNEVKRYLAIEKSKIEARIKKAAEAAKKKRLEAQKRNEKKKPKKNRVAKQKITEKPLEVGVRAKLRNSSQIGEVVKIEGEEVTLVFGQMKAKVKKAQLKVI